MATKKTAKKTSSKVELKEINVSKRQKRKAKTKLKKFGVGFLLIAVIVLAVSAVGAWFITANLTKNDCFVINGNDEITLTLGENYIDEGAKIIAFNKDISSEAIVETNLTKVAENTYTSNEVGTFYIIYKSNHIKYGSIFKVQKIRLINFVEISEGVEGEA